MTDNGGGGCVSGFGPVARKTSAPTIPSIPMPPAAHRADDYCDYCGADIPSGPGEFCCGEAREDARERMAEERFEAEREEW